MKETTKEHIRNSRTVITVIAVLFCLVCIGIAYTYMGYYDGRVNAGFING
jgi:hypothetical protein